VISRQPWHGGNIKENHVSHEKASRFSRAFFCALLALQAGVNSAPTRYNSPAQFAENTQFAINTAQSSHATKSHGPRPVGLMFS
jgi:hypothetical protein